MARKVTNASGKSRYACDVCHLSHETKTLADVCCSRRPSSAAPEQPGMTQVGGDHYTKLAIQPWDIIDTWPVAERVAYYRGNAMKYLMRLNDKDDPVPNARTAEHYCAKLATSLGDE